jgi:phage terminase small subunit
MGPLRNSRRERFCLAIMEGMTQADAYLKAGFKNSNSCRANAARLIATDSVRNRIGELKAEAAASSQVTTESLIRELEEVRKHASSDAQWGSAVKAILGKASLAGITEQRIRVTHETSEPPPDANAETIAQWAADNWEGVEELTSGQKREFGVFLRGVLDQISNFLASLRAANAKPVPQISPPARPQVEIERKRLGLR